MNKLDCIPFLGFRATKKSLDFSRLFYLVAEAIKKSNQNSSLYHEISDLFEKIEQIKWVEEYKF